VSHITVVAPPARAPLGTLSKAGLVLDLFIGEQAEWGVRELALRLGLSRSTAHSLLASLEAINLLQRTPQSRYRLGWRLLQLAGGITEAPVLRRVAPPRMRALTERGGESTHLAVWDGREMFFFARACSPTGVAVPQAAPGMTLPAHATASGKVLLSHLPNEASLRGMLDGELIRLTHATVTDPSVLWQQVGEARHNSVATSIDEVVDGISSVAVPVRGADGRVVAALGVSMLSGRLEGYLAEHARRVVATAEALSADVRRASTEAVRSTIRGLALEVDPRPETFSSAETSRFVRA